MADGWTQADLRLAHAQMRRNKRLVESGETFRARYDEAGPPITPERDELDVAKKDERAARRRGSTIQRARNEWPSPRSGRHRPSRSL